jgi:hypothetical protein
MGQGAIGDGKTKTKIIDTENVGDVLPNRSTPAHAPKVARGGTGNPQAQSPGEIIVVVNQGEGIGYCGISLGSG